MSDSLSPDVAEQIETVSLDAHRPLLICDADEVLVRFGAGMEAFLDSLDLYYDWTAFHFEGTIRRRSDDTPIPNYAVAEVRERFLSERIRELPPVDGAPEALARLAAHLQIVILTNIPHEARAGRIESLRELGMTYPVITNVGGKGHAVRDMTARAGPTVFVDDLPEHHESVALHADQVHRIQFIEDPRLERLVGAAEHSHHKSGDWGETEGYIRRHLGIG